MNDIIADFLGEWSKGFNIGGVALKIALTVLLGALVGSERATKRHAAGLRTFMLVSLVSTLSAMVDKYLIGSEFFDSHRLYGNRYSDNKFKHDIVQFQKSDKGTYHFDRAVGRVPRGRADRS